MKRKHTCTKTTTMVEAVTFVCTSKQQHLTTKSLNCLLEDIILSNIRLTYQSTAFECDFFQKKKEVIYREKNLEPKMA